MANCTFIHNYASYGGALFINKDNSGSACLIEISNCYFTENSADWGAGIQVEGGVNCNVVNSLFVGNSLQTGAGGGGGMSNINSKTVIINCTFYDNSATLRGGGLLNYSTGADFPANITIINSILWANKSQFDSQICNFAPSTGTAIVEVSYCCIQDGIIENGNINSEPLFIDAINQNFQLSQNSACIDAGTCDITQLKLPAKDLAGNDRILDGNGDGLAIIDIGAYEAAAASAVNALHENIPNAFCLEQNFPNPFNPQTNIIFGLSKPTEAAIGVFNLKGEMFAELFRGKKQTGYHSITWNAENISAGIYFIRMQAGNFSQTRKCVLIK